MTIPVIHQVGPKYGVRDYLSKTNDWWENDYHKPIWVEHAERAMIARLQPEAALDAIIAGLKSEKVAVCLTITDRTQGERLRKKWSRIKGHMAQPCVLTNREEGRKEEGLFIHDLTIHAEKDRIIGTVAAGQTVITRHALERIYERENVATGDMPEAISKVFANMRHNLAYALHAGIATSTIPDPREIADTGKTGMMAVEAVPCGQGLLVIETVLCFFARRRNDATRVETRRSGSFDRGAPLMNESVSAIEKDGVRVELMPIHMARTYLSPDLLRPSQIEYATLFREAAKQADIDAIDQYMFGLREVHNRKSQIAPEFDEEMAARLRAMLPKVVTHQDERAALWTAEPGRLRNT